MNELQIYKETVDRWGIEAQVDMLIEECAELIVELQHMKRGRSRLKNVMEEIADVSIMCNQIRTAYRYLFSSEEFEALKQGKLDRLVKRLKGVF